MVFELAFSCSVLDSAGWGGIEVCMSWSIGVFFRAKG